MPQPTGSPLFPISPDRLNQQRVNTSPTKSLDVTHSPTKSGRGASDVQAKVAFLNRLSNATTPERPTSHISTTTAALQRAILGREEAESALRTSLVQLSEANARERRVSERLESLVEELHTIKERQAHERGIFEKEVRKARKEAFRAGSTLVKAQEELKFSRGEIKSLKEDIKNEREAREKAEQEAFERAYAFAGLTEELETVKGKLRSSEAKHSSEAHKPQVEDIDVHHQTSDLEGDVQDVSPETRGLKRGQPDSIDPRSPSRKRSLNSRDRLSGRVGVPESLSPPTAVAVEKVHEKEHIDVIENLNEDLQRERRMRREAEDMIHFLKMECQFKRCSCRLAETRGGRYIHDISWDELCQKPELIAEEPPSAPEVREKLSLEAETEDTSTPRTPSQNSGEEAGEQSDEPSVAFCPDTGTFRTISSPKKIIVMGDPGLENEEIPSPLQRSRRSTELVASVEEMETRHMLELPHLSCETQPLFKTSQFHSSSQFSYPDSAPADRRAQIEFDHNISSDPSHKVFTAATASINTTTIPLRIETQVCGDSAFCPIPPTPINREEALAQIRARRDRTQCALKRSASANDANTKSNSNAFVTPMRGSRRIPQPDGLGIRSARMGTGVRRDISAPITSVRKSFR
ncbi:hypothetical protein LOZ30_002095 [Ophidiomyces ophidiicola]|nr:hypothetical protein LOZ30_002095 [Ophidiomyces ophidiicola]